MYQWTKKTVKQVANMDIKREHDEYTISGAIANI